MKPLIQQFEDELSDLVDKYSGMELTNSEAVGVLHMQINYIENQYIYERLESLEGLLGL